MVFDYIIVGGGIVGLATTKAILASNPDAKVLVMEKEPAPAMHQTGHNSGVIHAGVYYAPGSMKAGLCRKGAVATKAFCEEHNIAFDECGKLIVATNTLELSRMDDLQDRATRNLLNPVRISGEKLSELEPNVSGIGALQFRSTGIVSYRQMSEKLVDILRHEGVDIRFGECVTSINDDGASVIVCTEHDEFEAKFLIGCAGLQADRVAKLSGVETGSRIIPFRGEYFRLPKRHNQIIKHLIYPVPDPDLPFLGVHLTRMIDGSVTVGPNAVLGFAREKYAKFSVSMSDVANMATFSGFWKMLGQNLSSGIGEMKNSVWKRGYLEQCRKYCPELTLEDLVPIEAGIRAQAVRRDGSLVHDFEFASGNNSLHVINAPSPAATSAFPIGEMIANEALGRFAKP